VFEKKSNTIEDISHFTAVSTMESRFSDLLVPIRDLARNWDVDIAVQLEEYLDELLKLRFTVNNSSLNFAEAALLIQGSATIYRYAIISSILL
jgi:hypothetical protein